MFNTKHWSNWHYENGKYFTSFVVSPKQMNNHAILHSGAGWMHSCSVSHENSPFLNLKEAMKRCELFELTELEEQERYEFELDRKADD